MARNRRLWIELLSAPLAGAAVGTLILGVGGRLAMAGIMLLRAEQPRFSLGGSLDVVLMGALYGLLGGVLLLPLRRVVPSRKLRRGVTLGLILLLVGWLTSSVGRDMSLALGPMIPSAIGIASVMFVVYGVVLDRLVARVLAHTTGPGGDPAT